MKALLTGLIDYAGLFPPAALPMTEAVRNYAAYRASGDAWMLGRFVLPVARLAEFAAAAAPHFVGVPWRLSVLAQASDLPALLDFNRRLAGRAVVDAVEAKASHGEDVAALAPLQVLGDVFVEIPLDGDPDALLIAIGVFQMRAKIRTGGVTADAFPSPTDVIKFLSACVLHGVAFKATAGLHHPWRGEYPLTYAPDAPRATMHGFLNLFLAALFLRDGLPESDVEQLLEERDPSAFTFSGGGVAWRGHVLSASQVREGRARFAGTFGSCSFREPIDDLSLLAPS